MAATNRREIVNGLIWLVFLCGYTLSEEGKEDLFGKELSKRMHIFHKVYLWRNLIHKTRFLPEFGEIRPVFSPDFAEKFFAPPGEDIDPIIDDRIIHRESERHESMSKSKKVDIVNNKRAAFVPFSTEQADALDIYEISTKQPVITVTRSVDSPVFDSISEKDAFNDGKYDDKDDFGNIFQSGKSFQSVALSSAKENAILTGLYGISKWMTSSHVTGKGPVDVNRKTEKTHKSRKVDDMNNKRTAFDPFSTEETDALDTYEISTKQPVITVTRSVDSPVFDSISEKDAFDDGKYDDKDDFGNIFQSGKSFQPVALSSAKENAILTGLYGISKWMTSSYATGEGPVDVNRKTEKTHKSRKVDDMNNKRAAFDPFSTEQADALDTYEISTKQPFITVTRSVDSPVFDSISEKDALDDGKYDDKDNFRNKRAAFDPFSTEETDALDTYEISTKQPVITVTRSVDSPVFDSISEKDAFNDGKYDNKDDFGYIFQSGKSFQSVALSSAKENAILTGLYGISKWMTSSHVTGKGPVDVNRKTEKTDEFKKVDDMNNKRAAFDPFSTEQTDALDTYEISTKQPVITVTRSVDSPAFDSISEKDVFDDGKYDDTITTSITEPNIRITVNTQKDFGNSFGIQYQVVSTAIDHVPNSKSKQINLIDTGKAPIVVSQPAETTKDYLQTGALVKGSSTKQHETDTDMQERVKEYYLTWHSLPQIIQNKWLNRLEFDEKLLSLQEALLKAGKTNLFINGFWPFSYDIVKLNQLIAFHGISGAMSVENVKSHLYSSLYGMYSLPIPFAEDRLILSFNDHDMAELMSRSKLLNGSDTYIRSKAYTYSDTEKTEITQKVNAAMELIKKTAPELYRSINQLISCIALYKSEHADRVGGSASALPGLIYITPIPDKYNWSVPFYAEQIVHEFIHNALYLEEFIIGTYTSHKVISQAKSFSSIRGVPRNFDLSFHAAYVSTGLVTFHSRAGFHSRAKHYARPLAQAVQALVAANREHGVLTPAGEAMLRTLVDYVNLMKIGRVEI